VSGGTSGCQGGSDTNCHPNRPGNLQRYPHNLLPPNPNHCHPHDAIINGVHPHCAALQHYLHQIKSRIAITHHSLPLRSLETRVGATFAARVGCRSWYPHPKRSTPPCPPTRQSLSRHSASATRKEGGKGAPSRVETSVEAEAAQLWLWTHWTTWNEKRWHTHTNCTQHSGRSRAC
jgi:hypothetical protein